MAQLISRTQVRRHVVEALKGEPWDESGVPYDVLLAHAGEPDLFNRFAVKVGESRPWQERQRAAVGVTVRTPVLVRFVVELRAPPDQVADLDAADDLAPFLLARAKAQARAPGISLGFEGIDEPRIDPTEGRWFVGGFRLFAQHRLALE